MIPLMRWFFPVKTVTGDADVSPGCAPSLLFLTGPESREKKLTVSTSIKSRSPSPKMIVSSARPRVVSFVELSDNLAPPRSNLMENYDARRSSDGQPTIKEILLKESGGGSGSKNVVVIVDATREFSLTALLWAFTNVVKAGDAITLLGILHQVQNPSTLSFKLALHTGMSQLLGYKQKADVSAFVGTNRKQLDEEISRKLEILRNACMDPEIHGICDQNGIKLEVKIAAGPSTKSVAARWAADLQASWVILDRAMKKDKKHLMEHLDCNLVLMKRSGGEIIRLNQPILDDEYVSGSILSDLTPIASGHHFLEKLEIERSKDEQSTLYTGSPPQFGYQFSPPDSVYHRSGASSSLSVDPTKSETTASDGDSGSETVDMKNVNSFDNLLHTTTSDPPSDSEATCYTVAGTSEGDNQLGIDSAQSTLSGSTSFQDLSGALSSSAASLDCYDGSTEQSLTPTNDSICGTDLATDLQRQMPNVTSAEENSGSAEISPRNASATTFNKDWPPKSQSVVQSADSPRLYQSVYSISPSSTRPPSSQGRVSSTPVSTSSAEALNVYHPKPLSAKKTLELNDLLTKSGSFGDRTAATVRVRDVDTFAVSESRQTSSTKTPPVDIAMVTSKTPVEGVVHDESKSATPPSISSLVLTSGREIDRLKKYSLQSEEEEESYTEFDPNASMRGYMFMSLKRYTTGAPPLCSICNHKSPEFGRPPRKFTYAELEVATNNFSPENFLAEGGYGFVYKGVLKEGQAVAVKQHKLASSQGDMEFCSEVEVLSCAQHRNLVTLIGYCVENRRRLLVYEFVCNGSLDWHLSYRNSNVLEWQARQKIAVGAARGLRYLHEECRVGCIVHRDMRPNNILLTHDFQPMVGDLGLARWQPSGDTAVETRVIGTLGYLAPEYAETGQITEKADVYSFGVVLLELITGRKAIDPSKSRGEQCLTEWARPKLEERATHELLDTRLEEFYDDYELYCMVHAASLCIRKEPLMRPKMSQVLRILEGDKDTTGGSSPLRGSFSRTPSTEAFTPNRYMTTGRMDALDSPYSIHPRTCDPTSVPTSNSNSKSDREPFISHSAPLTGTSSRNSKSSTDERVYPLGGSRSISTSSRAGTSPKAWSPKLSYQQML